MGDWLIIGGCILILLSFVWLLYIAFGSSFWWGLAILVVPGAPVLFTLLNLKDTWNVYLLIIVGLLVEWGGKVMGGRSTFFLGITDVVIILVGAGGGYLLYYMGLLDTVLPVALPKQRTL